MVTTCWQNNEVHVVIDYCTDIFWCSLVSTASRPLCITPCQMWITHTRCPSIIMDVHASINSWTVSQVRCIHTLRVSHARLACSLISETKTLPYLRYFMSYRQEALLVVVCTLDDVGTSIFATKTCPHRAVTLHCPSDPGIPIIN